jgi:hypothetical protein
VGYFTKSVTAIKEMAVRTIAEANIPVDVVFEQGKKNGIISFLSFTNMKSGLYKSLFFSDLYRMRKAKSALFVLNKLK